MEQDPSTKVINRIFTNIHRDNCLPPARFAHLGKLVSHFEEFSPTWEKIKFIGSKTYLEELTRKNNSFKINKKWKAVLRTVLGVVDLICMFAIILAWIYGTSHGFPLVPIVIVTTIFAVPLVCYVYAGINEYKRASEGALGDLEFEYRQTMRSFIKKFLDIMANIEEDPARFSYETFPLALFHEDQNYAASIMPVSLRDFPDRDPNYLDIPLYYRHSGEVTDRELLAGARYLIESVIAREVRSNEPEPPAGAVAHEPEPPAGAVAGAV